MDMITANNNLRQLTTRLVGALGMCFPIAATFFPPSDLRAIFFITGSILMFVTAAAENDIFFSALQLVVLAGASMHFAALPLWAKGAVPLILTLLTVGIFIHTGQIRDRLTLFGCLGIASLAIGYGTAEPYVYLIGGFILAIYASMSYLRGVSIAILWAVLNTFFTFSTLISIFRFQ